MITNQTAKELIQIQRRNNTAVFRAMVDNEIVFGDEYEVKVGKGVQVVFVLKTNNPLAETIQLNPMDVQVQNAIYTLSYYGVTEFTAEQLAGMICSNFDKRHSKAFMEAIDSSIKKMNDVQIMIDAEEQYLNFKRSKMHNTNFNGPLLSVKKENGHSKNGRNTYIYRIEEESVLGKYASEVERMVMVPLKAYQCLKGNLTYERLMLLEVLLHRLMVGLNPKNKLYGKPILLFGWNKNEKRLDGLIGSQMTEIDKRKIDRLVSFVKSFLEELKKQKVIRDYEIVEMPYIYNNISYKRILLNPLPKKEKQDEK